MSLLTATVLALAPLPVFALLPAAQQGADVDWSQVWSELAGARLVESSGDGAGKPEALAEARESQAELLADLRDLARRQRGDPRGALLDAQLRRHFGAGSDEPSLLPSALDARPYQGPELWLAVEVMVPGPERTALAVEALRGEQVRSEHVRLAYEVSSEDGLALRLRDARALQEALHAHQKADWSAANYASSLRLLDLGAEADAVLAEQIGRSGAPAELWYQRGLITLGLGPGPGLDREREARGYLGRALALGSSNAGVVLGRLALDAGKLTEARAQFRALVTTPDAGAWALRGWGLAQLPARGAQRLVQKSGAPAPTAPAVPLPIPDR